MSKVNTLPAGKGEGDINLSSLRSKWQENNIPAETRYWLEEDEQYYLHQSLSTPCLDVLASCDGATLTSLSGKNYLDFHGNSVHQVGFSHPKVKNAIIKQLETLPFCTRRYTNISAIQLAKKLSELKNGEYKTLFAPGATSAVGMALKLARLATGRFKTISMWDSFHGASLDAISVGGESVFRTGLGPLLTGCEHVPPPNPHDCIFEPSGNCAHCDLRCAKYIEYVLAKEQDIAAVIAEPVRCTAISPPPTEFWKSVQKACDKHGALLIFDETAVCLGRTGEMFAHLHYEVDPDILILGKGLGGGIMPLAAMMAKRELDIAPHTALGHYTHEKNPLSCAAALATIEAIEEEQLVQKSKELGIHFQQQLERLKEQYDGVNSIKGMGLMVGVWLDSESRAEQVMYQALENGMSFKISQGKCLTLTPPLTVTKEELNQAVSVLDLSLAATKDMV